jgi:circadian clock protein KaiB
MIKLLPAHPLLGQGKKSVGKKLITIREAKAAPMAEWDLRLYVAGTMPRSSLAIRNLQQLCEEHLAAGNYRIEIVDLSKNPQLAIADQIFALPTLMRKGQIPIRKFVGNLSDTKRVLANLDMGRTPDLPFTRTATPLAQ